MASTMSKATDFQESDVTPLGLGLDRFLEKASSKILCSPTPPHPIWNHQNIPLCTLMTINRFDRGIEESISSPPDPSWLVQGTKPRTDFQESDITPLDPSGKCRGRSENETTDFQESDNTPLGLGLDRFLEKASSKILCSSPTHPSPTLESSEHYPVSPHSRIPRVSTGTRRVQATDFHHDIKVIDITPLGLGLDHFLEKASSKKILCPPTPPLESSEHSPCTLIVVFWNR
ncbi:hypothetical protein CEXT_596871 [Caerostris extrusa]|uniref:Uncharacterized protein n=1 Tax=Caerostris extrusa TaxID=172846 RepID=A0AAV4T7I1_CAEEX|nr:hypothetical protein CEXT_596871 [Caerostris extrusa]